MFQSRLDRRAIITLANGAALCAGMSSRPRNALAQAPAKRVRLLLNTAFSGPQAWFLLADDLGYFRREGWPSR